MVDTDIEAMHQVSDTKLHHQQALVLMTERAFVDLEHIVKLTIRTLGLFVDDQQYLSSKECKYGLCRSAM